MRDIIYEWPLKAYVTSLHTTPPCRLKHSPLAGVFRNPKFDSIIFLSEPDQSCSTSSCYCQAQKDVDKWVARDTFAIIVKELFHASNYEALDGGYAE